MKKEIAALVSKFYPQLDIQFYFRNNFTISSFFNRHMHKTDKMFRASVVYCYTCDCCRQSYIGSTKLQMFVRCSNHFGLSYRTNKPITNPECSAIRDHSEKNRHFLKLSNFSILDSCNSSDHSLRILESLYINRLKPALNRDQTAVPLNFTM